MCWMKTLHLEEKLEVAGNKNSRSLSGGALPFDSSFLGFTVVLGTG